MKFGTDAKWHAMTKHGSKSKPEVEFQYDGPLYSETRSISNILAFD